MAHKVRAMEIIQLPITAFLWLKLSLAQTDSQALKQAEIEGLAKK